MINGKSYYQVLGVLDDVEEIVIRAAYKSLAGKYHPDKWSGDKQFANARMTEINIAYDCLSNSEKRRIYDEELKDEKKYAQSQPRQSSVADETLASVLPLKSETSWRKYSLWAFTLIPLVSTLYLLKPESYRVEAPQHINELVTTLSYDDYRKTYLLNNDWKPYVRQNRIESWRPPYPEVQYCYEDSCVAHFTNEKTEMVAEVYYSICTEDRYIQCPMLPDGFLRVEREKILSRNESDADWMSFRSRFID